MEVLAKAATDSDGKTLQLVIPARRSLNARLADEAGPTDEVVAVESVSIDSITRDWPRVDVIKVDVEGAEESVWAGMQRTISQNPELILILEFNVARYDDPRAFVQAIESKGFPLRYIDVDAEVKDVTIDELLTGRSARTGCSTSPAGEVRHMEGLVSHTPMTQLLRERGVFDHHPFALIDVGCSGGIAEPWRAFGRSLIAHGYDPDIGGV